MPVKERTVPFDEIKEGGQILPTGAYHVVVGKFDEKLTSTGKTMLFVPLSITAPDEAAGLERTENFVIGMDGDLECANPETFLDGKNVGAKNLKRLAKAAKVSGSEKLTKLVASIEGKKVGIYVTTKRAPRRDAGHEGEMGWDVNINRYAEVDKVTPKMEALPDVDGGTGAATVAPQASGTAIPSAVCAKCGDEYPMQETNGIAMYGKHVRECTGVSRGIGRKTLVEELAWRVANPF